MSALMDEQALPVQCNGSALTQVALRTGRLELLK